MKPPLLTINFRDDSIMLDEGILEALGRPSMVQIMLNKESKILLLRSCDVDSEEPFLMPKDAAEKVELPGRTVLRDICRATGWEPTWPRICMGQSIPEYQAVYFELEYAIPVVNNLSSDKPSDTISEKPSTNPSDYDQQEEIGGEEVRG